MILWRYIGKQQLLSMHIQIFVPQRLLLSILLILLLLGPTTTSGICPGSACIMWVFVIMNKKHRFGTILALVYNWLSCNNVSNKLPWAASRNKNKKVYRNFKTVFSLRGREHLWHAPQNTKNTISKVSNRRGVAKINHYAIRSRLCSPNTTCYRFSAPPLMCPHPVYPTAVHGKGGTGNI